MARKPTELAAGAPPALLLAAAIPLRRFASAPWPRWATLAALAWIVPTLDGVPYLEKPPLLYWLTALSYSVFGVSELSTRAAPVLGLLLSFCAIAWFAWREWGERTAIVAVCIAASSPLFL